jgi:hypothetical protein
MFSSMIGVALHQTGTFCIIASNFDTYHESAKLSHFVTERVRAMLKSLL